MLLETFSLHDSTESNEEENGGADTVNLDTVNFANRVVQLQISVPDSGAERDCSAAGVSADNTGSSLTCDGVGRDRDKSPDPESPCVFPWPKQADKVYDLIASCGSGSFAQVYKACKRSTGEIFAIKVMAGDKWAAQEASILRTLDHENICKLYDDFICEDDGVACLVMQFATGGDLLERMVNTGPLTEKAAADIARQILLALKHMHSKGVVHRDIKPENILYSR